jgi:hypothetical protein
MVGAFVSGDAGATWQQQIDGLEGRAIFKRKRVRMVPRASSGWRDMRGIKKGILRLRARKCESIGDRVVIDSHKVTVQGRCKCVTYTMRTPKKRAGTMGAFTRRGSVRAAAFSGVYRSADSGANWTTVARGGQLDCCVLLRPGVSGSAACDGQHCSTCIGTNYGAGAGRREWVFALPRVRKLAQSRSVADDRNVLDR